MALSVWFAACGSPANSTHSTEMPPVSVELATLRPQPIRDVVDLVGQLEADESVVLKPETEGVIATVEFAEGEEVEKGALLFHLNDDEQRARSREAEAQLVLAADEYERAKTLAKQKTVSQSELDAATAQWEAAKARRDLARVQLERMEIRAPFDGVLGARLVSPGDRVDPDIGLVRIDAVARLRLVFTLPEVAVPVARVGARVEVTVAPWPEARFPGEVYFVAPSLEPSNRRLLLKAWVPNAERRLRPGMFANIGVEIASRADALVIPESAVAYDANGAFVWRIGPDDVAERVAVGLGIRHEGEVEITSGLQAGDRFVTAGTHKVSSGARVEAARDAVAPVPGTSS